MGVISSVIGYFQYYACATVNKNPNYIWATCLDRGPGAVVDSIYVYYDLFTFFLQILLLWLSFFLLPCSKQKGAPRF